MAEGPIGRRDRRRFLAGSGAGLIALAAPSLLRAQEPGDAAGAVRRNVSSFRLHDWEDLFGTLGRGILLSGIVGPGSDNPLGTLALYLSWRYCRIHGTNDTRKIGRRSSNGCIGLYNRQIAELFERVPVGTQVKII